MYVCVCVWIVVVIQLLIMFVLQSSSLLDLRIYSFEVRIFLTSWAAPILRDP